MKTSQKSAEHEVLVENYDDALAAYERAKTKEKSAKHAYKTATKGSHSKLEIEMLRLEYLYSKYRKKTRKVGASIAKLELKLWLKTNNEESEKAPVEAPEPEVKRGRGRPRTRPEVVKEPEPAPEPVPVVEVVPVKAKRTRRSSAEAKAEREAQKAALLAGGADFTVIEGIGAKVTTILHESGIKTIEDLAATTVDSLKELMRVKRNNIARPDTWPTQAQYIVEGRTEELNALVEELRAKR